MFEWFVYEYEICILFLVTLIIKTVTAYKVKVKTLNQ